MKLKEATEKLKHALQTSKREAWREKTENLNLDREGSKLWKLTKILPGDKPNINMWTLDKDNRLLNQKEAVDALMEYLSRIGNLDIPQVKKNKVKWKCKLTLKQQNQKAISF